MCIQCMHLNLSMHLAGVPRIVTETFMKNGRFPYQFIIQVIKTGRGGRETYCGSHGKMTLKGHYHI